MASSPLGTVLEHIRSLVGDSGPDEATDRQLLERFSAGRDEAAFAALVRRHAGLVLGVCWRRLRQAQDVEDVFQATFLVLARKAASRGWHESVANWLYEVAHRLAAELRGRTVRRQVREKEAGAMRRSECLPEADGNDLAQILDGELWRLPERYRAPLLLCYLEGKTRDEAARHLGCPLGTLKHRLERGREVLRGRLLRRGVTLSAVLLAAELSPARAGAADVNRLVVRTAGAAARSAAGPAVGVSSQAATLAEGVLRGTIMAKLRTVMALVLAAGLAAAGSGWVGCSAPAEPPAEQPTGAGEPPQAPKPGEHFVAGILREVDAPLVGVGKENTRLLAAQGLLAPADAVRDAYREDALQTPLREAVAKARVVLWALSGREAPAGLRPAVARVRSSLPPADDREPLPDRFLAPADGAAFRQHLVERQKAVAQLLARSTDALEELEQAGPSRGRESKRWQANYDLVLARLRAQVALLYEYQSCQGRLRREDLPPRDPKVHKGWKLVKLEPTDMPRGDPDGKRQAAASRKLLDRLVREHPDTPWAEWAGAEQQVPLGLEWRPAEDVAGEDVVRGILRDVELPPVQPGPGIASPLRLEELPAFSARVLERYRPDNHTTPLRQAVLNAQVLVWAASDVEPPFELRPLVMKTREGWGLGEEKQALPRRFPTMDAAMPFKKRLENRVRETAKLVGEFSAALEELEAAGKARPKESRRWQANYDYTRARMAAQVAHVLAYSAALGHLQKELDARDRAFYKGWRFVPGVNLQGDPMARDRAAASRRMLEQVIQDYPETPWAYLARRDLRVPLGLEWQPPKAP
jgi:RNA polymerase sigma factor (sigma-70 family)